MMRVLDASIVIGLLKGNATCAWHLAVLQKQDVVVPEIVLAKVAMILHGLPEESPIWEVRKRFAAIKAEIASLPWTSAVTDAFLRIKKARPDEPDFEAAVEAHAIAIGGVLLTVEGEVKVEVESGKSETES
jgi:hypothetical protein